MYTPFHLSPGETITYTPSGGDLTFPAGATYSLESIVGSPFKIRRHTKAEELHLATTHTKENNMTDFETTVITKLNNIIGVLDAILNASTEIVDEDIRCICTQTISHDPNCPVYPYT